MVSTASKHPGAPLRSQVRDSSLRPKCRAKIARAMPKDMGVKHSCSERRTPGHIQRQCVAQQPL
eukprot:6204718-Pleurochrysis_carterae.AAC.3